MSRALRVLCLDIEGGYGGSSRSLFESLRHMDREVAAPEVWCRRAGPIAARYAAIGIPSRVEAAMPRVSALPRFSRNVAATVRFAIEFAKAAEFRQTLLRAARKRFDLVHYNHESLFWLARWLKRRAERPQTMHIRTMLHESFFARRQARIVAQAVDRCIFITENERDNMAKLAGRQPRGQVIYNIAQAPPVLDLHSAVPRDARLKVAILSNYAWVRGIDRMINVAAVLATQGRRDIFFVIAGDMTLSGTLNGSLGALARRGGSLADYAHERGVADHFLFLGHVKSPETVLAACDVLAKPTREDNPWGRDILEAMGLGLPVVSVGQYQRFVENGETGFLLNPYSDESMAHRLIELADDRGLCRRLGAAAAQRVARLCDGPSRASELAALWRDAAGINATEEMPRA